MSGVIAVAVSTDAVAYDVGAGGCTLYGWSVVQTSGAAGRFQLRVDSASGAVLADEWCVATNGRSQQWYGPQGVRCQGDLWFENVSGTFAGVVYVG